MEISQTVNLYITFIEKEGPFLKVWGQTDKSRSLYLEQFLLGAGPQFDLGISKISLETLQAGTLVAAKYKDNKFYRARIINAAFLEEGFVEVSFIDYGNKDTVPCANIRSMQCFPTSIISMPPLATGFIFAEAHCPGGGEWNDNILESISKEIKYRELQCTVVFQAAQYYLVKLFIGSTDLGTILISRGYMQPISLQAQQAVLLSMSMQRTMAPIQPTPSVAAGINTYKACTLDPGSQYSVYVSYVNDGPCHFSVQLKQSEEVLVRLMSDINSIPLRLFEDVPMPGTICLARCQEDGNVCRAVITNEVDTQFKVFYVDFGNYEVVPLDALYQIPFKYVIPNVMALRYSLHGVEKSTLTLEMQCAFKQFVDNRLLIMKVLPTPTRMAISKCELWDPETKTSALDVVNRAARNAYPEPISLNRGFSQPVKVSYVYSCNRFYVQLVSRENELLKLMLDLQAACQTNDSMDPSSIKEGLPCCALFESDQQWYRSEIVEVLGNSVKVRYIDYGNEEIVPCSQLKIIDGEQLTVLRPQAIECCLNGYQNMEEDPQRDGFLEDIILERQFTMKVAEMTNKKALVELFDDSNYNVASLLLDKLASVTSQVSPLLVQAGNKIEHRKSFSNQNGHREQSFRQDRKPGRPEFRPNDRNENPWRQDKKDYRANDRNSNEHSNERSSWRQNNKGFSPNHDKFNRDKTQDRNRNRNDRYASNKENLNTDNWDASADNNTNQVQQQDDWNTSSSPTTPIFQNNVRENDFSHNKGNRYNKDNRNAGGPRGDSWNCGGPKGGGFKKRGDFRRDGSDMSSSGSEKSFQKGPRTSSRADRPQFQKKFDKPRNAPRSSTTVADDSWNISTLDSGIDAAPATANFVPYDMVGCESNVVISWFHNPGHFYCQLADIQNEFKNLMAEIQQFYKGRKPESAVVGAPVIGLFPEDNVLYRAKVLEAAGNQYKVYYVDFGNVSSISKVWPIEKKFMNLPAQAIVCSLNEIAPPNEQWPNPDSYSTYFDKDTYLCRFVNKDEEKTYVEIFHGKDDIKQLLIREGLVVSTQKIIPDIEIPLLLGQQFRAVLKSVNNLSDIIIALECGVAISCKMHNLEEAVTTDENNLKRFLERTVIIYVDNVIDDRLDVTMYDTEGSKIEVVSPDEGACDAVELPCPILIFRSIITGYVSHVDEMSVFIQPTDYTETVAALLNQMYETYENMTQDITIIPEVELLYAAKSEDGNWYRVKVMNISDTQATVNYIDYGNSEDIDFGKIRQLSDKYLEPCILCIQVYVSVPSDALNALIDKDVTANVYYGENGWEGTVEAHEVQAAEESSATESAVAENVDSEAPAEIPVAQESTVLHQDFSEPSVTLQETRETDNQVQSDEKVESQTIPNNGTEVIVSHIDSPNEFYLQLAESLSAIEELQRNLQEQALEMPVLENPTTGILCAAPFSLDQQWYRAEVLDADDDITTVRFVDYGNTDVISNETTEIKTLPPNLLSLAVYATRSSLKVKSVDGEWSSSALGRFEAIIGDNSITAEFIDQDEKTNYVELYSNGQSVKDILINEHLAVPFESPQESKSTCFVSHLNSPSEFWVQLENCVDELEWIAEQLSGAENFPELEDTTPGTLCAALFPDDQMWYRARILSNTVAGLELLFIDYGNSSISSSLRQLPEDLVVTSPLAQKCSLQKPDGIPYWSAEAAIKFNEISADGQTIFTVHKISTGETSLVQLFVDGNNVSTMLLPETEDGYVKNVEDLECLTLEKNEEILPATYKLEPMIGMTWTEESVDKFKELINQGMKFQIEFLPENTIRLYIDGKDIRTNLGGIKSSALNVSRTSTDEGKTEEMDSGTVLEVNETLKETNEVETDNKEIVSSLNNSLGDIEDKVGITTNESSALQNELTSQKEVENSYLQTSMDDIKHVLGIFSENATLATSKIENISEKIVGGFDVQKEPSSPKLELENENLSTEDKKTEHECGVQLITKIDQVSPNSISEGTRDACQQLAEDVKTNVESVVKTNDQGITPELYKSEVLESSEDKSKEGNIEMNLNLSENNQLELSKSELNLSEDKEANTVVNDDKTNIKEEAIRSSPKIDSRNTAEKIDDTTPLLKSKTNSISEEDFCPKLDLSVPEDLDKSQSLVESEIASILANTVDVSLPKKETENRSPPVSSCSGKISHDERIVPGVVSRPHSPLRDDTATEKPKSRPTSACSGKICHDERIVPAVLSRPQSPIPSDESDVQQSQNET